MKLVEQLRHLQINDFRNTQVENFVFFSIGCFFFPPNFVFFTHSLRLFLFSENITELTATASCSFSLFLPLCSVLVKKSLCFHVQCVLRICLQIHEFAPSSSSSLHFPHSEMPLTLTFPSSPTHQYSQILSSSKLRFQ